MNDLTQTERLETMKALYAGMKMMFRHVRSIKGADLGDLEETFDALYQQTIQELLYAQKVAEAMQMPVLPVLTAVEPLYMIRNQMTDIYELMKVVRTGEISSSSVPN